MPGSSGMRYVPALHPHAVGEAAIGLEQVRIALIAAQPEPGGDVERHLVAAMRDAAPRRPSRVVQHVAACAGIRTSPYDSAQSNCSQSRSGRMPP